MPSARITSRMHSLVSAKPSVGPVLERLGRALLRDPRHLRGEALGREGRGVGSPPASEITSGRAVISIRSRIALERITRVRCGEQAGVALEIARRWCGRAGGGGGRDLAVARSGRSAMAVSLAQAV